MTRPGFITEEEVKAALEEIGPAFRAVKESYRKFSRGETVTPSAGEMGLPEGMFYSFQSYIRGEGIFISKQATDFRSNREKGLPTVHPYIDVYDVSTGVRLATIEGRHFAGVRTALSSAVGIEQLAEGYEKMAIIGSGVQAHAHAIILPQLFGIDEIAIYSPTEEHRQCLVDKLRMPLSQYGTAVQTYESSAAAVADADVVITATSSSSPDFEDGYLKDGALVVGVGAMAGDQEIPLETMHRARIVLDAADNYQRYPEIKSAMDRRISVCIAGEIGDILNGEYKIESRWSAVVFKHHGLPVTDAALAKIVYKG